jgi:Prophage tail length tape measure protein
MADDRIDVEVTDKVSPNVEKKLIRIADAADRADGFVASLKAELASMNVAGLVKLETTANSTTRALAAQMNAQARLANASAKSAVADAKAATEKQRLATETARTEAAQVRAASAAVNLANAQLKASNAANAAASNVFSYTARANALKSALDPAFASQARFNSEVAEAKTLLAAGAINIRTYAAAVEQANARLAGGATAHNQYNNLLAQTGKTAKLTGMQTGNLVAQFNDIGVSLASGQNPLLVFIQQGSQIQYLASTVEGGFRTLIATTLRMAAPFTLVAGLFGVAAAKLAMFKNEIDRNSNTENFAKTLGLTKDELKTFNEEIEKSGGTAITWGDLFTGVMATIQDGLSGLAPYWDSFVDYAGAAVNFVWDVLKNFAFGMVGLMKGAFAAVKGVWQNFGPLMGDIAVSAANAVIAAIEFMVNKAVQGINILSDAANSVLAATGLEGFGTFGKVAEVTFGRIENQWAGTASKIGTDIMDAAVDGFKGAEKGYNNFVAGVRGNTIAANQARQTGVANQIKEDRNPAKAAKDKAKADDEAAKAAERREFAMANLNRELDNELSRMKELKDERAISTRFDQIEEQLAKKKITLSFDEAKAIRAKIKAVEDYKFVQAESDRIYEASVEPLRTYNSAVDAAGALLKRGAISQKAFNEEVGRAGVAYTNATDPLASYKRELEEAEATLGLYGNELRDGAYLQGIMNDLAAQFGGAAESYRAEATALASRNAQLQNGLYIQQQLSDIMSVDNENATFLENMAGMYAEIDRMREADKISEENAQRYKWAIQQRYDEIRLAGASSFFGELAGLQSSNVKELAAIGKAAAIADATIKGYQAAQNALATVPFPFNIAAAAAIALKTGANVAAIASTNVGSFATGGQFMVEGRAGIDNNNINMNVSRGERVTVETPAQQRANDAGGGTNVEVKPKIVNLFDEKSFIGAMDSDEGEEVIMNIIQRRKSDVGAVIGVPS